MPVDFDLESVAKFCLWASIAATGFYIFQGDMTFMWSGTCVFWINNFINKGKRRGS